MKTAVSQVYSILNSNEKTKNIDFYTNSVPESAQTVPSLPVGRITEISGNYEDFASNNIKEIKEQLNPASKGGE
ncbi:MAG: hypothetical protein E6X39_04180 [Enterococcus hirae]|nr:hypothetical protein [Enterococcus hirae]